MGEHSKPPWSVEYGQSPNHREGYYVVDAGGRALWDNGGSDGGVCYEESVARLIADAWAIPDLVGALIREHDANHPNPAGPTCGCPTCQLLARIGAPGDGRR